MSKFVFVLLLVIGTGFQYSCKSPTGTKDDNSQVEATKVISEVLSVEEYGKRIASGNVQLVDVRTPEEVAEGQIMNALNVDYNGADFQSKMEAFDKNEPIYIYCKSGNRSGKSAVILQQSGFQEIYDLQGGYDAWSEAHQ